jgi:uncharacterized membrane protein
MTTNEHVPIGSSELIKEKAKEIASHVPELSNLELDVRSLHIETQLAGIAYSGPLPPPDMMRSYEGILPGAFERILSMTENSLQHGQIMDQEGLKLQGRVLEANITIHQKEHSYKIRGQWFGLFIIMLFIAVAAFCIWKDQITAGVSILVATALTGIVTVFITGTHTKQDKSSQTE